MPISIQNRQKKERVNRRQLLRWGRQILSLQGCEDGELGIIFVSDRRIRTYNRAYRNHDKPTDVLAFPMREGIGGNLHPTFLGDVMISVETAARDARTAGRPFQEQIRILLIHGILHLMGYDHERSAVEARRMRRQEGILLNALNAPLPNSTGCDGFMG